MKRKPLKQKLQEFVLASEIRIAAVALILAAFVVVWVSWGRYSNAEFVDGIRVEAHGMLLDILVIGIFILWLNLKRDESERVRRYEEEIDDFRNWPSDEAAHRIAGHIRRLNAAGRTSIFLSGCFMRRANLRDVRLTRASMQQVDLGESNLRDAELVDVDLDTAFLGYSDMRGAKILNSNLKRARLTSAKAGGVSFRGSNLQKATLNGASLRGANFQDCEMEGCKFDGADLGGADLRGSIGLSAQNLARAHSLSYARFDKSVQDELEALCPELLKKSRRRDKLVLLAPPSAARLKARKAD